MILIFSSCKGVTANELNGWQAAGAQRVLEPRWPAWDPRNVETTPQAATLLRHPHVKASPSPVTEEPLRHLL